MQILIARQPIFDLQQRIAGYELFYRGGGAASAAVGDTYEMAQHVVANAFLGIGLDRLTEGQPAFLKVTPEMLLNGSVELLDAARVVPVIDSSEVEPEVVEACEALVQRGYNLVVDAPEVTAATAPLLKLAGFAKVDVHDRTVEELTLLVEMLRPFELRLIAAGVENATLRDACVRLGFELFQGYRFNEPEVIAQKDLAVDTLNTFRLMKEIRNPNNSDSAIEEGFRRDVALSYKLLRIVNSAAMGGREVQSIGQAIRLLGRDALNRWLALLLVSSAPEGRVKEETAFAALLRGRVCEVLAPAVGRRDATGTLYIVGMFSMLPLLLGISMETVIAHMNFSAEANDALLSRAGTLGQVLALVEAYEAARWDEVAEHCAALKLDEAELTDLYLDALPWARERSQAA
jgi:EAL and modified HD-GYP domain-containing signal transduction protein